MGKKNAKNKKQLKKEIKEEKGLIGNYFIPESKPVAIIAAIFLLILVWIGLRLWWDFEPGIILPIILGVYASALLKKSDLPLVCLVVGIFVTLLFPLPMSNNIADSIVLTLVIMYALSIGIKQLSLFNNWNKYVAYGLVVLILTGFFFSANNAQNRLNDKGYSLSMSLDQVPPAEQYGFDAFIYLKIFYLMKSKLPYYQSFKQAVIEDARLSDIPRSVLGWRLPTVFYIWDTLFKNGSSIATGFLFLSILTVFIGFLCAKEISSPLFAIPTVAFLAGYFFYGATSLWIVFMEYWGLLFSLLSFWLFIQKKSILSSMVAIFAPLIREVYIFVMAAGFIGSLITKRIKSILPWVGSGIVFIVLYLQHYRQVKSIVPSLGTSAEWLHGGGIKLITESIKFSTNYFSSPVDFAIFLWLLGLIGLFLIDQLRIKVFAIILAFIPILIFTFLGNEYSYYWGITCVPIAYIGFAPLLASLSKISR